MTSPRTGAPRPRRPFPASREITEQSQLGALYMRSLIRTQRTLGLLVVGLVAGGLATLPLVFTFAPSVSRTEVLGIGLPWVLLGAVVFPVFVLAGWFYVRQAERSEREFAELVERS
ncbi:MAG: hypothetical protein ABIQ18_04395 [Umezawaea sp.]